MKKLALMVVGLMLVFTTNVATAREEASAKKAKKAEPIVKVPLENERVKVHEVRFRPGDKDPMKERPDRVQYILKGGKLRLHLPDGTTKDSELKAGTVRWRPKDTFAAENVGKTEVRFISVDLK